MIIEIARGDNDVNYSVGSWHILFTRSTCGKSYYSSSFLIKVKSSYSDATTYYLLPLEQNEKKENCKAVPFD